MHGDLPNSFYRPGNGDPTREELARIVNDICKPLAKKYAPDPKTSTRLAIEKSKAIHTKVVKAVRDELGDVEQVPFIEKDWFPRLLDAYRVNFNEHLTKDEIIEVLAVIHTEQAIGLLR